MFKFGFELEGFFLDSEGSLSLPPKNYPTDGFPGLCEVRTVGGKQLEEAYFDLLRAFAEFPFCIDLAERTFSPQQKRLLRARSNNKESMVISNIYGKEPKALGNRTLASLQINISNLVSPAYTDDKGTRHPDRYGLFDFVPIIAKLDKLFAEEIKTSGRQAGFYSVKDGIRVEYRSLPCTVFKTELPMVTTFLNRIKEAF